jgi:hypothetical protein
VSHPLADVVTASHAADRGCHGREVLRGVASGLRHVPGWSGLPAEGVKCVLTGEVRSRVGGVYIRRISRERRRQTLER